MSRSTLTSSYHIHGRHIAKRWDPHSYSHYGPRECFIVLTFFAMLEHFMAWGDRASALQCRLVETLSPCLQCIRPLAQGQRHMEPQAKVSGSGPQNVPVLAFLRVCSYVYIPCLNDQSVQNHKFKLQWKKITIYLMTAANIICCLRFVPLFIL